MKLNVSWAYCEIWWKIMEKSKRGGARPGSGRKPGNSPRKLRDAFYNNINTHHEARELLDLWKQFKAIAVQKAHQGNTEDLQWIFSRIMPVPKEQEIAIDHTTQGQALTTMFNFPARELTDWTNVSKTVTIDSKSESTENMMNELHQILKNED